MSHILVSDLMSMCGFNNPRAFWNKIKRSGLMEHTFKITHTTHGQKVLAINSDHVELFREKCLKSEQCGRKSRVEIINSESDSDDNLGWFYAVQTMPTLNPNRIKLGFAGRSGIFSVDKRLNDYRTILGDDMNLIAKYPCHHRWECGAIHALTAGVATLVPGATELFDFKSVDVLLKEMKHYFVDIMKTTQ